MNRTKTAAVVGGIAVLALGISAPGWASNTFSDTPTGAEYHDAVDRLGAAGITKGCTTTTFCPDDSVKRSQMALFLDRLSGNGPVAPSVDAATVQGFTPEQLRGQTGPAGPAGPTGPRGPSNGFFSTAGVSFTDTPGEPAVVATQDIPADGVFLTTGKLTLFNTASDTTANVTCFLGTGEEGEAEDQALVSVPPQGAATIALVTQHDTTGEPEHTLALTCVLENDLNPEGGDGVLVFDYPVISTTQVGAIEVTSTDTEPENLTAPSSARRPW